MLHKGADGKFKVNPVLDVGAVRWKYLAGRSTQKALFALLQAVVNDGNLLVGNLWPDCVVKASTADREVIDVKMLMQHFRHYSRDSASLSATRSCA